MSFDLALFVSSCNVPEPEEFLRRCDEFFQLLSEANSQFNLTRLDSRQDYDIKHVADSLAIVRECPELIADPQRQLCIADVGCGAGFPSVILASAFPFFRISAIDSTGKKAAFVASAAEKLQLPNLNVINGRANELARKAEYKHRFDIVTARAVAAAPKLRKEAAGFLKRKSGCFYLYQTPAQSERELPLLKDDRDYQWCVTPPFELPESAGSRGFLIGRPISLPR